MPDVLGERGDVWGASWRLDGALRADADGLRRMLGGMVARALCFRREQLDAIKRTQLSAVRATLRFDLEPNIQRDGPHETVVVHGSSSASAIHCEGALQPHCNRS